ncbi:hypothetical protein [Tropicimonas sediminicola]|uniref:Uncharacterized protein n=1 Tax=Tropicimonas sediminicola TaxID=1031541 RepID=A0A239LTF5_9RHOB|nr:hypothetical protein [Tropicimonas sediminicola]SNT33721.1 hypothetical protein SAMN05421757_11139 [Tropicimonas sediminicola]
MIIGVTLLSTIAGLIAAVVVGFGGSGWIAIVMSYFITAWICAISLVALAVVRDLLSGNGPTSPGSARSEETPFCLEPTLQEMERHNASTQSARALHA